MIDFDSIKERLQLICDFIGGEFYIDFKNDSRFNVYNPYDKTSDKLIKDGCDYLMLYQTDTPFRKNNLGLLQHYKKVFSVNNTVTDNDNVISLPLGIVDTAEKISFATCYKHRDFSFWNLLKKCRDGYDKNPHKLLYLNYRIPDNLMVRKEAMKILDGLTPEEFTDKTFNGQNWLLFNSQETYVNYFNELLDHVFVSCPEGYGIDSYRFYETLYLGRIPVVLHNPVTDMFKDLPILFLDKWEDFSLKYREFMENFDINNYNFEKLTREYWNKVISGT